jgi:hypothetical protein
MRLLGTVRTRYTSQSDVARLLLGLDRIVNGARQRVEADPRFAALENDAQASLDRIQAAFIRMTSATAELKNATAALVEIHAEVAVRHRQHAGLAFCLVGEDAQALNDFGLRLEKRRPRKARPQTPDVSPADGSSGSTGVSTAGNTEVSTAVAVSPIPGEPQPGPEAQGGAR